MPIEMVLNSRVPVKIWTDRIEPEAIEQLRNIASLPIVHPHVAAMPDVHLGKGATVGAVVPTRGAICPAAVGVDIGCGMSARKTSIPADRLELDDRKKLRHSIEREIPVGREQRRQPFESAVLWMKSNGAPRNASKALIERARLQLGTLGGGNHFIEVCVDRDDGLLWALLHSGSRYVGKTVAETHIARAKRAMGSGLGNLPDPDLAWLTEGTSDFDAYAADLDWCQRYARENRAIMMERLLRQLAFAVGFEGDSSRLGITTEVDCHHNYVSEERHFGDRLLVTRKGAISARAGSSVSSPGRWGPVRTSCAASGTRIPSTARLMEPGGRCRGARRGAASREKTWSIRRRGSNAAKTRGSWTRSRRPTSQSRKSSRSRATWSK